MPDAFWQEASRFPGACSTVNFFEFPRDAGESTLSRILQVQVPEKYYLSVRLSVRACNGILERAARKGKTPPDVLNRALLRQSNTYALWRTIASCEEALDRYEGSPRLYRKERISCVLEGKKVEAYVYIKNDVCSIARSSLYYYNTIAEGYSNFGFDKKNSRQFHRCNLKGDRK